MAVQMEWVDACIQISYVYVYHLAPGYNERVRVMGVDTRIADELPRRAEDGVQGRYLLRYVRDAVEGARVDASAVVGEYCVERDDSVGRRQALLSVLRDEGEIVGNGVVGVGDREFFRAGLLRVVDELTVDVGGVGWLGEHRLVEL